MHWKAEIITHKKEKRVAVWFQKDATLIARIKLLDNVKWSNTLKVWHLPDTKENRLKFKLQQELVINPDKITALQDFEKYLKTKRYSESTIKTYVEALKSFLVFYNLKPTEDINNNDVVNYHHQFILKKNLVKCKHCGCLHFWLAFFVFFLLWSQVPATAFPKFF